MPPPKKGLYCGHQRLKAGVAGARRESPPSSETSSSRRYEPTAEALLELLTKHPDAKLRLAQAVAETIAIPLNVAAKDQLDAAVQELKRWAEEKFTTKEELKAAVQELEKWAEERFTTKEELEKLKKWAGETFATKEDTRRIENKMATKEQFEALAVSVEGSSTSSPRGATSARRRGSA